MIYADLPSQGCNTGSNPVGSAIKSMSYGTAAAPYEIRMKSRDRRFTGRRTFDSPYDAAMHVMESSAEM